MHKGVYVYENMKAEYRGLQEVYDLIRLRKWAPQYVSKSDEHIQVDVHAS